MRSHVGKLVSLRFDHGIRVVGTLTIRESGAATPPLYGVDTSAAGSATPWNDAHRFRASAVTTIDEIA